MPSSHLYVRSGATGTAAGRELLNVMEQLADGFDRASRLFDAMTQSKDNPADVPTSYVTPASVFGITNAVDALDGAEAQRLYAEFNSFIGNSGPALLQFAAQLKQ